MSANAKFQLGTLPPTAQIAQTQSDLDYANALQDQNTQAMGQIRGGWGEAIPRMLAAALLHSQTRDDATKLASQTWGQYQGVGDALLANLKSDPPGASAAPPPPPQATPGPQSAPSLQIAPNAPASMPGVAPTSQSPLTAPFGIHIDPDLVRMVAGEARGEGALGQQAVAGVAMNRARESGMGLGDVVRAPHQFDGYTAMRGLDPSSPVFQQVASNIAPLLNGQMANPAGSADHFYAPQGMAGGKPPAWDNGTGQMIGHHNFLSLGYGGGQPSAPSTPSQAMAAPPMPQAAPTVSANDPNAAPPPLTSPAGAPPAAAPPAQAGGMGGAPGGPAAPPPGAQPPPVQPQGIPTGPHATPQEVALVRQYLSNPLTFQQGMQMAQQLQERAASPAKLPDGYYYGPDGRAVSALQFQDLPGSQNEINQVGPDGRKYSSARAAYGSIPAGMELGGDGKLHVITGGGYGAPTMTPGVGVTQQDPTGKLDKIGEGVYGGVTTVPGAEGTFQRGPDGQLHRVADAPFSAKDAGGVLQDIGGSEQYKLAQKSGEMFRSIVSASQRPGGIPDAELKDVAAQVLSGGVARQFGAKMLEEGGGPLNRLKQFAPMIVSGQQLSPEVRQAIVQAVRDKAVGDDAAFRSYATGRVGFAKSQGQDLSPFVGSMLRNELPDVPSLNAIPNGMPGHGNGGAPGGGSSGAVGGQGGGYSRAALEAEARRRGLIR